VLWAVSGLSVNVNVAVVVSVTVEVFVAALPAASRAVIVSTFDPVWRTTPLAVQLVVPVAVPLPPRLFAHVTWVTPTLSDAVPPRVRRELLVVKVGLEVGDVMVTVGAVASLRVTVKVFVAGLPAASRAVTVSTFDPAWRTTPLAVQLVVPAAVPLPPRLFAHVTWVTPTLSDAVPPRVRRELLVAKVGLEVGDMMVTVGGVVSVPVPVPVPVASREMVSPSAVKVTFALTVADAVGVKRTVTVWVAPEPPRVNGLPDTMLKGAEVDALPVTVPPRVFWTVKTWFAKLPMLTFPKLTALVGDTAKSAWATPLAAIEQALSLPFRSTALIAT
jgi:hypothetical protein